MGTDKDWEKWGADDPYFGVNSDERFRTATMTAAARKEFFASGEAHIARTLQLLRDAFGPGYQPGSALDFGCGVGRLVMPLAHRTGRVTGVDISPSMLAEAQKNCTEARLSNATFVESDDGLSQIRGGFDLVHSYIVLQHIAWRRGRLILQAMADHVAPGGCLAVQMLTEHHSSPLVRGLVWLRYLFPPANWLRNLLRSRPLFEPAMQLHIYDLEVVLRDLEQRGFICKPVDEPWPGFRSVFLLARRGAA